MFKITPARVRARAGATVHAQLERSTPVGPEQRLLYLDQLHWAQVAGDDALFARLAELRAAERIVVPVTWFSLLETLKRHRSRREHQLAVMRRLSGGYFLRNFVAVARLEWSRHVLQLDPVWVRRRVLTTNLGAAIGPGLLAPIVFHVLGRKRALETFEFLANEMDLRTRLDAILAEVAEHVSQRQRPSLRANVSETRPPGKLLWKGETGILT